MITAYLSKNKFQPEVVTVDSQDILNDALWIDLFNPTKEEEHLIEKKLRLSVPTRDEMQEIELSSRLYKENDALYMTVVMVATSDSNAPKSDAVTLILVNNILITIRYIEPHSFVSFIARLSKLLPEQYNATSVLIGLLDASIDRLADILENVSKLLDDYSQAIFQNSADDKSSIHHDYKQFLQKIGYSSDLYTKVEESLTSFNRLILFFESNVHNHVNLNIQSELTILLNDTKSLTEHVNFISNKVKFLFDATLGMISIEQNNIIRIFTIAAVILLPPTLIASIYGMNFQFMPELKWHLGYPLSIMLMLISGWIPYKYFKRKKWL
ncbi:MAG: magnesium transporter CorA family protein [Legionellales bacterium]|jgi:magnesium transporter